MKSDHFLTAELDGTLTFENQERLMIRSSDNAFWDSSFEIIGPRRCGTCNDDNACILRIKNYGQVEVFIDGVSHRIDDEVEIRFCGPWEYVACLNGLEALGLKAGEIKRREFSS